MASDTKPGILDLIKQADSQDRINSLLKIGSTYKNATDDTRRKWQKATKRRALQLA